MVPTPQDQARIELGEVTNSLNYSFGSVFHIEISGIKVLMRVGKKNSLFKILLEEIQMVPTPQDQVKVGLGEGTHSLTYSFGSFHLEISGVKKVPITYGINSNGAAFPSRPS
jgi:hypothetical protein